MPGLFGGLRSKAARPPLGEWRGRFQQRLLSRPEHGWIRADAGVARAFRVLAGGFTERTRAPMEGRENVLFHLSGGVLGSSFGGRDGLGVVIVHPDLHALLRSGAFMTGVAVLAHELGHIALDHSGRNVGALAAQLEADRFAFLMGFGRETRALLLEHAGAPGAPERVRALEGLLAAAGRPDEVV